MGKGIFAGAVTSVIGLISRKGGEKRSFSDIIKGAFGTGADTLWAYIAGIGAALILYVFISGGATRGSGVLAAAAAYLSARAALSGGFLQSLFGALLSKIKGTAAGSAQGVIRGLAAGFAASALIGYVLPRLVFIIAGLVLLAGGIVMMILQAKGVVKLGKGARA